MANTDHIVAGPRLKAASLEHYIKEKIEPIYRQNVVWGLLKTKNRMAFNKHGEYVKWRPKFRRLEANPTTGNVHNTSMPETNFWREVQLPWRSYDLGQSVSKFEQLAAAGEEQYFDVLAETIDEVTGGFLDTLKREVYKDGNSTTSPNRLHGFESWFANTGSLVTNSWVADPNDTYAGQSCALGVSGSWTAETGGGWPTGTGSTEYCWWSPQIVDCGYSSFFGTSNTWRYQWQDSLAHCMGYLTQLQSVQDHTIIMSTTWLIQAKQTLRDYQRFTTVNDSEMARLGFKVLEYDGAELYSEYGVPETVCYVLDFSHLRLWSMQGDIVHVDKDLDITTKQKQIAADSYIQMICDSPAFQGKIMTITAEGT